MKTKLYVHAKKVHYKDYGSHLETETGVAHSISGESIDAIGFERGATVQEKIAEMVAYIEKHGLSAQFEVLEGQPIERTCDYNPHGLM